MSDKQSKATSEKRGFSARPTAGGVLVDADRGDPPLSSGSWLCANFDQYSFREIQFIAVPAVLGLPDSTVF